MKPKYINNLTINSTTEHLTFDDTFAKQLPADNKLIYLRLWELPNHAIILGRSNKETTEVQLLQSQKDNLEIHKRSSGGGTVILGPGCLCYSFFIPTTFEPCNSIQKTNSHVMQCIQKTLSSVHQHITVQGHTDLCINNIKFSGNAQRRFRHTILFHGTILYNFNLPTINNYLKHPSKEPKYRQKRTHLDFLTNINSSKKTLEHLLKNIIF